MDSVEELKAKIFELQKENLTLRNKLQSVDNFGVERPFLIQTCYFTLDLPTMRSFLDGDGGVCSRLNYWASNYSILQSADCEKRGRKSTMLPIDESEHA